MATMSEIREFAKIKIGTNEIDEPFLISQRTLGSASKHFRKALRQDSFQEGRTGQIDFPEDDYDAWAVLAFWMMNTFNIARKELKPDLLIKCWVLGDKYEIPEFQDQIMLELLFMVQYSYTGDIIRLGSGLSPAGSVLKRLIAEEAAVALKNNEVDFESLEAAFNGNGMLRDFLLARDNCEADFDFYIRRFDSLAAAELYSRDEIGNRVYQEWRSPSWQNYMISNGSRPQWLLDEIDGSLRYG